MKKGHKFIRGLEITAIIILILSFITLAYCVYISIMAEKEYADNYSAEKTSLQTDVTQNEGSIESNISDIIEKVNNAVVGISRVKNTGSTVFLPDGSESLGLGTGFIVTDNGYIVTNQHVSGDKNGTCYVTLEDGRNFNASVVWADSDLDLSIIKINTTSLPYLELGDSDSIKVAQSVYAIGNPIGFEFQRTVTSGIISGLDRTIKLEEDDKTYYMEDLIQTDATINPGNSGGPLIDVNGKVLGINSVKITSAEGIGFAVPINILKPIIEKFKNDGEFNAATLGVFAYDESMIPYINQELGTNYSLDYGIYVASVIRNSPADKAGIVQGDIILEIDGTPLNKMSTLRQYIYEKNIGDIVKIKYLRNRKETEIDVTLARK